MNIIIVNPVSANGKGLRILDQIKNDALFTAKNFKCYVTEYEGHAEVLAKDIAETHSNIKLMFVIGGDGTLHEVVNGLQHYPNLVISFIPAGTGNDFSRGSGISGTAVDIFRRTMNNPSSIDYWPGSYFVNNTKRIFMNSIGFGFDALIVKKANQSKYKNWLNNWKLGTLTYVIALLQVLRSFKPMTVKLEIDGNAQVIERAWMVTVSNHPYYGGGMKILPNAEIQPNHFSILIVRKISHWKVLALFLTVFWGGHVKFKEVTVHRGTSIKIQSDQSLYYQVDGQSGSCNACHLSKQEPGRKIIGNCVEKNGLEMKA